MLKAVAPGSFESQFLAVVTPLEISSILASRALGVAPLWGGQSSSLCDRVSERAGSSFLICVTNLCTASVKCSLVRELQLRPGGVHRSRYLERCHLEES